MHDVDDFVRSAISRQDTMVNPAGHMAILAAISSKQPSLANLNVDNNWYHALDEAQSGTKMAALDRFASELQPLAIEIAMLHGLPEVVVNKLLAAESNNHICTYYHVSRERTQRLRSGLEHLGLLNSESQIRSERFKLQKSQRQCQISDVCLQRYWRQILMAIESGAKSRQQVRLISDSSRPAKDRESSNTVQGSVVAIGTL